MKNKNKDKVKQVKKAIGRLNVPPGTFIPDKKKGELMKEWEKYFQNREYLEDLDQQYEDWNYGDYSEYV